MIRSGSATDLWTRAKDFYFGLSLPMRLLTILMVAGVALMLVYSRIVPTAPEMTYLLGGQELKTTQLQAACRALDVEGLTHYEVDGHRIRVPSEQAQQYAAAVSKHDVGPNDLYTPFDRAAEQSTWLSTSAQDDRRWELAKQKSLAQTIELMPEVESASVLIDRAAPRGIRATSEVRATVTVKPRTARELPPFRIRQIRTLVAGSVANLALENVAVVDLNGRALVELGATSAGSDDLLMRMKEFEEHYAWKIRNVLSYLSDVMVTVSVELETTRQRRTEQVVHAGHEEAVNAEAHRAGSDTAPTVSANAATELEPSEAPVPEPPPMQQTWEEHVPLGPKSLTVSISVPQDVVASFGNGAASSYAEPASWSEPIRQRVSSVMPAGVTASISVTSYPRGVDRVSAAAAPARLVSGQNWIAWASVAVGLVALVPMAAWVGLWWHQARARRDRASQPRGRQNIRTGLGEHARGQSEETRRELVRVERDAGRDGRGPHIMQARICSFEDLRWLAPGSLQAVLGVVDSRLWAPALRGATRELCHRILTHMPARAATLLRDEIEFPGPVRLGDVETAQQEILEIVRRLDHTGDLVLEDREEILHE